LPKEEKDEHKALAIVLSHKKNEKIRSHCAPSHSPSKEVGFKVGLRVGGREVGRAVVGLRVGIKDVGNWVGFEDEGNSVGGFSGGGPVIGAGVGSAAGLKEGGLDDGRSIGISVSVLVVEVTLGAAEVPGSASANTTMDVEGGAAGACMGAALVEVTLLVGGVEGAGNMLTGLAAIPKASHSVPESTKPLSVGVWVVPDNRKVGALVGTRFCSSWGPLVGTRSFVSVSPIKEPVETV